MSFIDQYNAQIRDNGTVRPGAVFDVRTVVMPASYASPGQAVDLSSAFSTLYGILILRAYTTSSGVTDGRLYRVTENGTDTFANRKFVISVLNPTAAITPTGSVAAPIFSGSPMGTHTHNYDKADTPIQAVRSASLPSGVTVDTTSGGFSLTSTGNQTAATTSSTGVSSVAGAGTHTHVVNVNKVIDHDHTLAYTSTATDGVSAGTPAGTNTAPAFTGNASTATAGTQVDNATNLSTITVQYMAIGVPI